MAHVTSAKYPNFATKEALLWYIKQECQPNLGPIYDLLQRLVNTDLDLLADKSTTTFTGLP